MKIAVASDIHAYDQSTLMAGSGSAPSHLSISDPANQPTRHPIAGLKQLIAVSKLNADILVCPGDLTDKANPTALKYVWSELQAIQQCLGAENLIATAGNHDLDSRHSHNQFDAKGYLQGLVPQFPGLSERDCDRYWSRNFVLLEDKYWRILLLNSSAYHGGGKDVAAEASHGRVSDSTIDSIKAALTNSAEKQINVLICHHHLYKDNEVHEKDYSEMAGGDHLIRLLGSGTYGQWIVIHGHKHHPKLQYASGGVQSPVIFCAGSLCAILYAELAARARNQFYILEIEHHAAQKLGLDIAGSIRAWDWIPYQGWQPAGIGSGLPHQTGFGYKAAITTVAQEIANLLPSAPSFMEWIDVVAAIPRLKYILHSDLNLIISKLKSQYTINAIPDHHGLVQQIGKK